MTKAGIIALSVVAGLGALWFGGRPRAPEAPKGLEGTLGAGSPPQLRLVLTITKSSGGTSGGVLDSVDQGATLPLNTVTPSGRQLRFNSIGGV